MNPHPSRSRAIAVVVLCVAAPCAVAAETGGGGNVGASWSPYVVGALIGVLSMLTFYLSDKPLGVSTAYARVAGMLGRLVAPRQTERMHFYQKTKPTVDWEVMLLVGVIIGAGVAAWTGGDLQQAWLPGLWVERFGADSHWLRGGLALAGGTLLAIGSRLAGGCTSGHGISGTLQLSVGSWISVICFFLGGMAVAMPLFHAGSP